MYYTNEFYITSFTTCTQLTQPFSRIRTVFVYFDGTTQSRPTFIPLRPSILVVLSGDSESVFIKALLQTSQSFLADVLIFLFAHHNTGEFLERVHSFRIKEDVLAPKITNSYAYSNYMQLNVSNCKYAPAPSTPFMHHLAYLLV